MKAPTVMPKATMAGLLKALERAGADLQKASETARAQRERAEAAEAEVERFRLMIVRLDEYDADRAKEWSKLRDYFKRGTTSALPEKP